LTTIYYLRTSDINPKEGDRIYKLAELRNLALQPLWTQPTAGNFSASTTVIFINDVAICLDDILELVYQRHQLGADMTCAFDWTYAGHDPTFYDVWVARGMNGDTFFEIPADGNWNSAWNLFWNNPSSQQRFEEHRPFQAFSCWNGATAFTAAPLLDETKNIRFRSSREGECYQGEPQLFCKDMWYHGHGKIAVIPSINLEYSDERGRQIKQAKGYTSALVAQQAGNEDADKISWQLDPPERVKCMASYDTQHWVPWNETLAST
jgi:alpha-1,3-mannosyltransferase